MSGALETAACAFAVVGVADAVIRTARELYSFFCDVHDAPKGVEKLKESIQDTIQLVEALKKRTTVNVDPMLMKSVEMAVKTLSRELQSIKLSVAKFKGAKTTWSKIKFSLDDRKISKALVNLERSKTLLANALTIVYGESTISKFDDVSTLIDQVNTKVENLSQTMISSLNMHRTTIETRLDTHHRKSLDIRSTHKQALSYQLDTHHQPRLVIGEQHQRSISRLQTDQANISSRQQRLTEISHRIKQRTILPRKPTRSANPQSAKNHQKTRDLLTDKLGKLHHALEKSPLREQRTRNEIYFHGEKPDMLMAYLLPLRDELNTALEKVLAQPNHGISTDDLFFLRDEFNRLIGSAAQEEAARYRMSTASSFDVWHFPGQVIGRGTRDADQQASAAYILGDVSSSYDKTHESQQNTKLLNRKRKTLVFQTGIGTVRLHVSRKGSLKLHSQSAYDLGFSYTSHSSSHAIVDVTFIRSLIYQAHPRVYTHLNVLTPMPDESWQTICRLFDQKLSVEHFYHAIRQGSISPYHSLRLGGEDSALLGQAVLYCRADVLRYFKNQGISIPDLRQPPMKYSSFEFDNNDDDLGDTFQYITQTVDAPATTLARMVLYLIPWCYRRTIHNYRFRRWVSLSLTCLCSEEYVCREFASLPDSFDLVDRQTLYRLISSLIEVDDDEDDMLLNCIWHFLPDWEDYGEEGSENLLHAYIQAGANIHALDFDRRTPSTNARLSHGWTQWCRVIHEKGKIIEEVVRDEGNEWLLEDGWEETLYERAIVDGWNDDDRHRAEQLAREYRRRDGPRNDPQIRDRSENKDDMSDKDEDKNEMNISDDRDIKDENTESLE